MYAFSYWHTYFDSAFQSLPLKLNNALYLDLKIDSQINPWPRLPQLPELPQSFQLLERYILTDSNWRGCLCNEKQMHEIELKLNTLIINMQCEKRYGFQFWQNSPRRIQASVVHLYLFLKMVIGVCLPQDCQTIIQANSKDRLTILIPQLQTLINQAIGLIRPIHAFMFRPDFQEESELTAQLFAQWTDLLKNLPTLSKQKLFSVPTLMEYICVVNPLQAKNFVTSPQNSPVTRSRTITAVDKSNKVADADSRGDNKFTNHVERRNRNNIRSKELKRSIEWEKPQSPVKSLTQNLELFRFKDKVKKKPFYIQKKKTITSMETKDKSGTEIQRSPTYSRNMSIFQSPFKLERTGTYVQFKTNQQSFLERRSREGTSKTLFSTRKSLVSNRYAHNEDIENEREEKQKKKKASKMPFKVQAFSLKINPAEDKLKGWSFVREWFNQRLAARRLKKIILF